MKKTTLILFSGLFMSSLIAQDKNVIWLSSTLEPVKQRKSAYKMIIEPQGSVYAVNTFDKENNVFMTAKSVDPCGSELQGDVIYYYPNGNIQSSGRYIKGKKVGLWKRFAVDGQEKAERVYDIYDATKRAYVYVDQMPQFTGGQENFDEFLKLSLDKYVSQNVGNGHRMVFSFIINENGNLENPKVNESVNAEVDREMMKVLESMPKWIPGKKQGENVRVYFEKEIYCKSN